MGDYFPNFRAPTASPGGKIRSRHIVLIIIISLTVCSILGFSLYGRGLGDPNCRCTTPGQASWNMGSVILVLATVIGLLILLWRPEMLVSVS